MLGLRDCVPFFPLALSALRLLSAPAPSSPGGPPQPLCGSGHPPRAGLRGQTSAGSSGLAGVGSGCGSPRSRTGRSEGRRGPHVVTVTREENAPRVDHPVATCPAAFCQVASPSRTLPKPSPEGGPRWLARPTRGFGELLPPVDQGSQSPGDWRRRGGSTRKYGSVRGPRVAPGESLEPLGLLACVPAGSLDPDVTGQPCQAPAAPRVLSTQHPVSWGSPPRSASPPPAGAEVQAARRAGSAVARAPGAPGAPSPPAEQGS